MSETPEPAALPEPVPSPVPEPATVAVDEVAPAAEAPQVAEPAAEPVAEAAVGAVAAPAVPEMTLAQTAAALAERFPALFGAEVRPIKLRIQADIQQRAPGVFTRKGLSIFLHRHTTSTAYLRSMLALKQRFDLDGAAAGEVAEEHLAAAQVEVDRRRAIVIERRQQAQQAQRQARAAQQRRAEPGAPAPNAPNAPSGAATAPAQEQRPPRPERPPRPARPAGPPNEQRAPEQRGPRESRDQRPPRPQREERSAPPRRQDRPTQRPQQRSQERAPDRAPDRAFDRPRETPAAPRTPEEAARRERWMLLRQWQSSPLTKANFCALKGMKEAEFDALVAQAQREQAERG